LFSFIPQINAEPSTPPTKFIYANTLGTTGYSISEPGTYVLVEDIEFAPTSVTANAITIGSSYVTLDFNTHSIAQTSTWAGVDGIDISADVHDVVVKNGTLHGFRGSTIRVWEGCFDLTFDSLNISGPDEAQCSEAMFLHGSLNRIHDVTISNCLVTEINPSLEDHTTHAVVCSFFYLDNLNIIDSTFNGNTFTNATGESEVLFFAYSYKPRIINCHFDDNSQENEIELTIINLSSYSNAAIIENCLFRYNQAASGLLTIINSNDAPAVMVKGCSMLNNHGEVFFLGIGAKANATSIESCTIKNCGCASPNTARGIYIESYDTEIVACRINDCHIIGGYYASQGIGLGALSVSAGAYIRNCRIANCSVQGITGNGIELTAGGVPPFGITGCIIENCLAEEVSADGFVITGTDNLIKDCRAVSNGATGFNEQGDNVWLTNLASRNGTNYSAAFGATYHTFNKWGVDVAGGYAVFENIDIP